MVNTILQQTGVLTSSVKINEKCADRCTLFTPEQFRGDKREVVYVDDKMPGFYSRY